MHFTQSNQSAGLAKQTNLRRNKPDYVTIQAVGLLNIDVDHFFIFIFDDPCTT